MAVHGREKRDRAVSLRTCSLSSSVRGFFFGGAESSGDNLRRTAEAGRAGFGVNADGSSLNKKTNKFEVKEKEFPLGATSWHAPRIQVHLIS